MRKIMGMLMTALMVMTVALPVQAEEIQQTEHFEMVEEVVEDSIQDEVLVQPYTKYLGNVHTTIKKASATQILLRADVYCSETVSKIETIFYLQKNYSGTWKTVSTGSASTTNASSMSKGMSVSGVSSGTYRAKTVTRVTDKYGYSESLTGYSSSITI